MYSTDINLNLINNVLESQGNKGNAIDTKLKQSLHLFIGYQIKHD